MRLFANALSGNSYKIRLLLAETGRSCEIVPVDIFKGESRTPEFIDCNPAGQTPVLELDDGRYLAESNAILCFLANGTALFPNDGRAQAQVLRWMFFEQSMVMPNIAWARFIRRFLPEDHELRARLPWLEENGRAALDVMKRHLNGHDYCASDLYTIANIALYGYAHMASEAAIALDPYPHVRAWMQRTAQRQAYLPLETLAEVA